MVITLYIPVVTICTTRFTIHKFHVLPTQCIYVFCVDLRTNSDYFTTQLVKCYSWSTALYGAETWMLWAVDHKHLDSFEMWCWRKMDKISWTHHVRNEEVLLRVKEQRNILHEISKRKANWIDHILRRNCLLKQVIEGKIKGELEVARRRGRRRRKLLDDLKDRRGYCYLKEKALDRTM